jgi:predicted GNAT family N-acyltransferase
MIVVRKVEQVTAGILREIRAIRIEAWRASPFYINEQRLGDLSDDLDPVALHWLAWDSTRICAVARLSVHRNPHSLPRSALYAPYQAAIRAPVACLSRLAVSVDARNQGLARKLDRARLDAVAEMRGPQGAPNDVVVIAEARRANMLKNLGFSVLGRTNIPTIASPHDAYVLRLDANLINV